ncbi:MAG: hypothetical protein LBR61_02715 [Synergistaceae bacterium]|nr:hypothetical protein [Synergistaceae bacterium]
MKERCGIIRLIFWFFLFSLFLSVFGRPFRGSDRSRDGRSGRRRNNPFAPPEGERGGDTLADRQAEERFEFQKRQAMAAGSMGYIWHAGRNGCCPAHRKLEGRFVPWEKPPLVDGVAVHAGERAGCSCTREIV